MEERPRSGASGTQHAPPPGRGKRRPERREGAAKRPRVESSSSDRRDGSEESRSGGGQDRPRRCSQRAAGPSTSPRRPIPASVSPRRSPRLTKSAVQGLRSLPLTTKGGRRTAHSWSVSGDERGQGPSRSSLSSSDHGRSSQGWRSRSREPTPPQLRNFDIGDFTVVSHTTDSFTFASQHHFFPGWVRVVSAHTRDRDWGIPCDHDAEEERRVKQRVRRDVEPPEVRRFLRQELLTKVVESRRAHSVVRGTRIGRSDRKHGCSCHRFSFFLLLSFYPLQGRGCLGERVAETPLPPLALWQTRTTGPGDRKRGGMSTVRMCH